jgi:predicted small secreted protein
MPEQAKRNFTPAGFSSGLSGSRTRVATPLRALRSAGETAAAGSVASEKPVNVFGRQAMNRNRAFVSPRRSDADDPAKLVMLKEQTMHPPNMNKRESRVHAGATPRPSRLLAFCLALGLLGLAPDAALAQSSIPTESLWVTNGTVTAAALSGTTLYIGGSFTNVGPRTGSFVAIDASTGQTNPAWPKVNGNVWATAPDGSGGWYIGGQFTSVGEQIRNSLAHILSDGTLDPIWNPNANSFVKALAVSGSTVYVVGSFTSIGGQSRGRIAALDASTGAATGWNPAANSDVVTLAVSGSTVYAGGYFTSIGGQSRNYIGALDADTGAATDWNPGATAEVFALAVSDSTVYAGGHFTSIGGQSRSYIAALDAGTGTATDWNPAANDSVYALAVSGSTVYAGGWFTSIGGQSRGRIAALDASTGAATDWNPDATAEVYALAASGSTVYAGGWFTSIGGQSRDYIAALDASTGAATGWNPVANSVVRALAVSGPTVYAGGWFTSIGGRSRNRIAALDASTGAATGWNPAANGVVLTLAVSGSTVYAGGSFTSIGGQSRSGIAALDTSTGAATGWNPNALGGIVSALAVSGSTVYAGGAFLSIGGQSRHYIAALDAGTGAATGWNPAANTRVSALAVSDSTVYAGGWFTSIGGQSRDYIAALDASTGAATDWNPGANGRVSALAVSASTVYAGGDFTSIGGQSRNYIAALDASTGAATDWNPNAIGSSVSAMAVSGSTVYASGDFTSIGGQTRRRVAALDASTGAATDWNPGANAAVSAWVVSGSTVYAGGGFTLIGGQSRPGIARFSSDAAPVVSSPTSAAVATTSATLGGAVTSDGGALITERGVVYSETATNSAPAIGSAGVTKASTIGTTGVFTVGVTGLPPWTNHSFRAYAINVEGTSYSGVGTFGTGPYVPGAPTIGTATAGNGQATVEFTASASDGGSDILDYAATCGASSATGAGSPITVTGLTNGAAVTCVVVARNAVGFSPSSGESGSVTPAIPSCTAGRYLAAPGDQACTLASPGHFVAGSGASSETACTAGSYQDLTGQASCKLASAGYYVASGGASSQTACASGYTSNGGATACTRIPVTCTAGTFSANGTDEPSACAAASVGHYVAGPGATSETACAPGSYQPSTGQTSCTLASAGYYVPSSGATAQIACAPGTISAAGATSCGVFLLSISSASLTEGNAGTKIMKFTVTRTGASASAVTVNWATASPSAGPGVFPATAGVDYRIASGIATIPAGASGTSVTLSGVTVADVLDEDDEVFSVVLSNPSAGALGTAAGVGTIVDDDATPTMAITGTTLTEGSLAPGTTAANFKVTLSAASGRMVTVHWATSAGSATADVDYQSASGDLTFLPGGALSQNVTVLVNQDALGEANETFLVTLTSPVNATLLRNFGTGQINNDDTNGTVRISAGLPGDATSITVPEGSSTAAIVYLTKANAVDVSVKWTVGPNGLPSVAAACADFFGGVCATGTVTIPAGSLQVALPPVQVIMDGLTEGDQLFRITLSGASPAIAPYAVTIERAMLTGKILANNN